MKKKLESTGYSALSSPPRLMRRAVAARWTHNNKSSTKHQQIKRYTQRCGQTHQRHNTFAVSLSAAKVTVSINPIIIETPICLQVRTWWRGRVADDRLSSDRHRPNFFPLTDNEFCRLRATLINLQLRPQLLLALSAQVGSKNLNGYLRGKGLIIPTVLYSASWFCNVTIINNNR